MPSLNLFIFGRKLGFRPRRTKLGYDTTQGRKPQPSPSSAVHPPPQSEGIDVVNVEQEGGTPQASHSARKRDRPPHAPISSGKDLEATLPHKRSKGSKDKDAQKRHSSNLDLEQLSETDFDHFRKDPLLFMAEVAKAGSRLISKLKQGEEERIAGKLLAAKNLWLEGDNLDKTDKLNRAYDYIVKLREQLETGKKKLQESEAALKPTADALDETKKSLTVVTKGAGRCSGCQG